MLAKLGIAHHREYFNSGVMLLNLDRMRRENIAADLVSYRTHGKNFFMDQDAFNVVFRDQVHLVSPSYNFLVPLTEHFTVDELKAEYGSFANGSCHQEMLNQVKIVHYASKKKPWKFPSEKSGVGWIRAFLRYRSACNDDGTEDAGHAGLCPTGLSNLCVSLTSYPPRIKTVEATIKSIMRQSYSPKTILLWLAREEFPRQEDDLPSSLLALGEHGLSIRWCDNLRSYKKLLPVLAERPDAAIVTADDDLIYPKDWLEQLIASYIQYPNSIHCHRAHRVTLEPSGSFTPYKKWRRQIRDQYLPAYSMLLTGCGGVLYPPGSLHKEVFSEATRSKHFQLVDDIWFWVMAIRNGTKIRVVPDSSFHLNFTPDSQECALWRINDHDGGNDTALDCVRTLFPDVVRRILMEIDGQHST
jgi:hypothetical protein